MKYFFYVAILLVFMSCISSRYAPKFLVKGDTIGILSLSSRVSPDADTALVRHLLDSLGFKVLYSDYLLSQVHERFGVDDSTRAAVFMQMILNRDIKAILCYRGGYGAVRTLDYIDWKVVRRNAKWIAGYSDVTIFHLAAAKAGMQSLHSTMPVTFCDDSVSLASLNDALTGRLKKIEIPRHPLNQLGVASGRLVGGNLSLIYSVAGTPEDKALRERGTILFIEEVGEDAYHIDRMMQNLLRNGKLARCRAIIVGHMTKISSVERFGVQTIEELIAQYTSKYNIPVIFGMPAGHQSPNMTMYMGRNSRVEVTDSGATIEFQ